MIEEGAHKEILEEDYEQYRAAADKHRERGNAQKAAKYYRECATLLEQIAEKDQSNRIAEKRRNLADNLRTAAEQLATHGELNPTDGSDDSEEDAPTSNGVGNDEDTPRDSPSDLGDEDTKADASQYLSAPPDMDFEDVGGMGELKETLRDKVIDPLDRPELYEKYDLGVVNAVLLYGPPGTGKTHLTEALAGELDYNFINVHPTDVTSSLVGEAAENVADLFQVAVNNQPCLVFIDEIDALMPARSGGSQKTQSERQMVNQFLTELTDVRGEDVIVVGATNLPDEVDDAAVSRFQERIEVPPPDKTARAAILRVHLRNRPALTDEIDWDQIKSLTEGYSARDLELVASNAARKALEDARGKDDIEYITQPHLEAAIQETESSLEAAEYEEYV